jgi:hypothetical protein
MLKVPQITPQEADDLFVVSLHPMTRSGAALAVAKRFDGVGLTPLMEAVAASRGGEDEVQRALARARGTVAALEALASK